MKRDISVLEKERKESFHEYKEAEDKKQNLMIDSNSLEEEFLALRKNNEELVANKG